MACCSNRANINDKTLETNNISSCCSNGFRLDVYNWLTDIPSIKNKRNIVEIRFKNTRIEFFENINDLPIVEGDIVAVEALPGHDIGTIALTGELVYEQLRKYKINPEKTVFKKIYRKAKDTDIEKWKQSVELEKTTMLRSRQIAIELNLNMKIGDVEYQGDKTKAIFYYIADERVDFRDLIKRYADEFKVRIEMKQIGARQEAGRIGGIGPCGNELCCAKWMSNFVSVSTTSARDQEISLHPQKLAGQCGKLKCCLNFEVEAYKDTKKDFPSTSINLEVEEGTLYYVKTDVFKKTYWYSFSKIGAMNLTPIEIEKVKEIIKLNKEGVKPKITEKIEKSRDNDFLEVVGQESLTRFDVKKKSKNKNRNKNRNKTNQNLPEENTNQKNITVTPNNINNVSANKNAQPNSNNKIKPNNNSNNNNRNNNFNNNRNNTKPTNNGLI